MSSTMKFSGSCNRIQSRIGEALSMDELEYSIPSIFARERHSSRTEKYTYVPTSNVIESMVRENYMPVFACQSRTRDAQKREFTKHMIRFRKNAADLSKPEVPEIILVNSHDGSSAYNLIAGIFRFVCQNGMVVGDQYESVHVKHQGKILDEVMNGVQTVAKDFDRALNTIQKFKEINLTPAEQGVFANAAAAVRFRLKDGEKPPIDPMKLLEARRNNDTGMDLWLTLNRVQENAMLGGQRGLSVSGRRTRAREIKGIGATISLNRALWTLAEKVAEQKAGSN